MKYHAFLAVAAFVFIAAPELSVAQSRDISASVDRYVRAYHEAGDFSGCIGITRGDDHLLEKCYGEADVENGLDNSPSTKFRIGSVSKQFTAVGILLLSERGWLSLQDPISTFIPGVPNGDLITIHHLLTHTSGIPNIFQIEDFDRLKTVSPTTYDLVEGIRELKPSFTPGERHDYSNSGYVLLANVIERVSGLPYGVFMRSSVFGPVGMLETGQDDARTIVTARASGYDPSGVSGMVNASYINPAVLTGAASLYSTVADMEKWHAAFDSNILLSDSSRALMMKGHEDGYGYGVAVYDAEGKRVVAHDGRIAGFAADYAWYPDDSVSVVVLSNIQSGIGDSFRRDLRRIVFGDEVAVPDLNRAADTAIASRVADYAGKYEFGPDFLVDAVVENGRLLLAANDGDYTEIVPLAGGRFLSRATYAEVQFELDGSGQVAAMIWIQDGNEFKGEKL